MKHEVILNPDVSASFISQMHQLFMLLGIQVKFICKKQMASTSDCKGEKVKCAELRVTNN